MSKLKLLRRPTQSIKDGYSPNPSVGISAPVLSFTDFEAGMLFQELGEFVVGNRLSGDHGGDYPAALYILPAVACGGGAPHIRGRLALLRQRRMTTVQALPC